MWVGLCVSLGTPFHIGRFRGAEVNNFKGDLRERDRGGNVVAWLGNGSVDCEMEAATATRAGGIGRAKRILIDG